MREIFMISYILAIVLVVFGCFFLRSCVMTKYYSFRPYKEEVRKIPKSVYFFAILSLIPFLGIIIFIMLYSWIVVQFLYDDYVLIDNKFTRYWFKY